MPAKRRMQQLLADPDAESIVRSLHPQELYWMVKEIGENDAVGLLALSSPEQLAFCLDTELWQRWSLSREKALKWLGYLVEAGEGTVTELLEELDIELLALSNDVAELVGGQHAPRMLGRFRQTATAYGIATPYLALIACTAAFARIVFA